jgi:thioredoxin 1
LEKEDFVQAVWKDMQEIFGFSVSGALRPGQATDVTGEQLDQEFTSSDTPILVDVYATWCGPCKMMAPELDKLAAELGKQLRVVKIDSDRHPAWAGRYEVRGLPTTLLIHKGQVAKRVEGAVMKDKLLELVQPYLLLDQ